MCHQLATLLHHKATRCPSQFQMEWLPLRRKTLEITSREVVGNTDADEDNLIDLSIEIVPQKIEAGDGSDTIAGGQKDDQIDGGAGDDEIKLTRTVNNVEEDAGVDEVLYEFDMMVLVLMAVMRLWVLSADKIN